MSFLPKKFTVQYSKQTTSYRNTVSPLSKEVSRNEFVLLVSTPNLRLLTHPLCLFLFIFRFQIPLQPLPSHKVYLKHGKFTIDLGKHSVYLILCKP